MTRRTTLSPREYRLLMAYLDGELSPRARARVEARLRKDDAWQKALEEARALKAALAQLPRARAPRAFTLTPAQAESVRRPRRQVPRMAYRWASALAALMFVVLLVGRGLSLGATGKMAVPPQTVNLAAPQAEALSEARPASEDAAAADEEASAESALAPAPAPRGSEAEPEEETKSVGVEAPQKAPLTASPSPAPTATVRPAPTASIPEPEPARAPADWGWYAALGLLLAGAIVLGWAGWRR